MKNLKKIIEHAFKQKNSKIMKDSTKNNIIILNAINETIKKLDNGTFYISEKVNNQWITHEWLKKAIILLFQNTNSQIINLGNEKFFDKCSAKFSNWELKDFKKKNLRIVPPANIRYGAYIGPNTVIMPSFINIGAYIDSGTMIDTWSTIGSCAHIGKNVHISGGVGIGGVLEPLQNNPTIIEDNCFIGSRSEIVEGVIIEEGSVISMGVFIGQSTKIYDRNTKKICYGRVPAGSVVIPGSLSDDKNNQINTYCAIIVKQVDSKTRSKIKLNELLRT